MPNAFCNWFGWRGNGMLTPALESQLSDFDPDDLGPMQRLCLQNCAGLCALACH